MPTNRKVAALIKDINQYGMMESRYFRIMISLLTISEELFDYALKAIQAISILSNERNSILRKIFSET